MVNTLSFAHDPNGNLLSAGDNNSAFTYSYDALNRLINETGPYGVSLSHGYDEAGNVTQTTDSFGGTVTSTYNEVNRLSTRSFSAAGQPQVRFDHNYNNRNLLEKVERFSDVSGTTKVGETTYAYDAAYALTAIDHRNGSGTGLVNLTYTYDTGHRLTSQTINGTTTSYTHDNTDQLTSDGTGNWAYDANGNPTGTGVVIGTGNRLQNDGTWAYQHDAEGNRTKKTHNSTGETWTYGYDHRNQLAWIEKRTTDGGTLELRIDYKYDVFNRRIEEARWKPLTGTVVTRFAYQGDNIFADLDQYNAITTRYLRPNGIDTLAARIDSQGNVAWYLTDRLGSVIAMTDGAGVLQNQITYNPFGLVTAETNPTFGDRFKFTGREQDADTLLQYNRHRYLDLTAQRWLTLDPKSFGAGDANLYRYIGNHATGGRDPFGLDFWDNVAHGIGIENVRAWDNVLGDVRTGWFKKTSDGFAGFADTMTFGLSGMVRSWGGYNDAVDEQSGAYSLGTGIATVAHAAYGNGWGATYGLSSLGSNYFNWSMDNQDNPWAINGDVARWLRLGTDSLRVVSSVRGLAKPMGWVTGAIPKGKYIMLAGGLYFLGDYVVDYITTNKTGWGVIDHLERIVPLGAGFIAGSRPGTREQFQQGISNGAQFKGVVRDLLRKLNSDDRGSVRWPQNNGSRAWFSGQGSAPTVSPPVLPEIEVTAGKNFKDHFIRHKNLIQELMGEKFPKLKTHGELFLKAVARAINSGRVTYVGKGTLKKGDPPLNIYRGNGVTIVTKANGEFVTALRSGQGLDLAIQKVVSMPIPD